MISRIVTMGLCAMALGSIASSGGRVGTKFECFLNKERRIEMNVSDLPVSVSRNIAENHAGADVLHAIKLVGESETVIGYEIVIKKESREQTIRYTSNGAPEK